MGVKDDSVCVGGEDDSVGVGGEDDSVGGTTVWVGRMIVCVG